MFLFLLQRETQKSVGNDSVEGIAFSRDTAVIMTGVYVVEEEVSNEKIILTSSFQVAKYSNYLLLSTPHSE